LGPPLGNNLINLGIWNEAEEAVASLGRQLHDLLGEEEEPTSHL
jgi:starch phosphorylase